MCNERAQEWQESLTRERAEERADVLGWSSSKEVLGSLAKIPPRGKKKRPEPLMIPPRRTYYYTPLGCASSAGNRPV